MAIISLGKSTNGSAAERVILPTDIYRMRIVEAAIEDNTLEKPNRDGTYKQQLRITWELTALTTEQQETADERDETWIGTRVWQRINPFYGDVREGGPSKFKAFIDKIRAVGGLPTFDLDAFDTDDLVGIEMKVSISEHTKTMGPNVGQPGNKVLDVTALRTKGTPKPPQPKPVPATIETDEDLPF